MRGREGRYQEILRRYHERVSHAVKEELERYVGFSREDPCFLAALRADTEQWFTGWAVLTWLMVPESERGELPHAEWPPDAEAMFGRIQVAILEARTQAAAELAALDE